MIRKSVLTALCVVVLASAAAAQTKVVTLSSGAKLVGQVTPTDGGYDIALSKGGTISVTKAQVKSIEDYTPPADEYAQRKAKAEKAGAANAWYELGEWAFEREMYDRAKDALKEALKLRPNHRRAKPLLRQVEAAIAAAQLQQPPKNGEGAGGRTDNGGEGIALNPEVLLTEEDVYRVRLEELREDDKVTISFQNDVIDRFVNAQRGTGDFEDADFEKKFRSVSSLRKARYMLRILDPSSSLRKDILVRTDPQFMVEFRSTVWPMVRQNCALAHCHGGKKPRGGFLLFTGPSGNDRIDYTNFILLNAFTKGGKRMIDRSNPDKSLLLQYALPKDQAQFTHPKKFNPAFRNRRDKQYRAIEEWVRSLAYPPTLPEYGLKYRPPKGIRYNLSGKPDIDFGESETKPAEKDESADDEKAENKPERDGEGPTPF